MKKRLGIVMIGVAALLVGCSWTGAAQSSSADSTGRSAPVEKQDEPDSIDSGLPTSDDTTPWGIPSTIGDYQLLVQFDAKDAGLCEDQIPILIDPEEGVWFVLYANDEAAQELADRNKARGSLPECRWVSPDSVEPYDEALVGLVMIYVSLDGDAMALDIESVPDCIANTEGDISDCGKADRSADVDECKSWDDGQYSACTRVVGSTGAIYNAYGNFNSAEAGEQVLHAFLEIFVERFEYTPRRGGAPG